MKDPTSIDIVESSETEDPIVMYLIVRESLGMSIGKTSAQVGHAVDYLSDVYHHNYVNYYRDNCDAVVEPAPNLDLLIFEEWKKQNRTKISLRADEKEWVKLKEECAKYMILVVDAGRTELPPNTETVIGLWPMRKSQRAKLVKRLQVLK